MKYPTAQLKHLIALVAPFAPVLVALQLLSAADDLPTIHLGTTPIDSEPYYAQTLGHFKAAGINADIQAMTNGSTIRQVTMGVKSVPDGTKTRGAAKTWTFGAPGLSE